MASKVLHPMETMRRKFSSGQSFLIIEKDIWLKCQGYSNEKSINTCTDVAFTERQIEKNGLQYLHSLAKLQLIFSLVINISSAA